MTQPRSTGGGRMQALSLEDFGAVARAFPPAAIAGAELETERLAAFDRGYKAGWDDAIQAAARESAQIGEGAAARLQDLGFTFHEARAHVMRAMTPLLEGIMTQLMPRLLVHTLGARIMEELGPMADAASDTPIDLLVATGEAEHLKPILDATTTMPLTLIEEASVEPGQLFLRLGEVEREIDLTEIGDRILSAIAALDDINKETLRHG